MARKTGRFAAMRERAREAGGWYQYLNARLISVAGPASVGPYDDEPAPASTGSSCPICAKPMSQHTFDRAGAKPRMFCP